MWMFTFAKVAKLQVHGFMRMFWKLWYFWAEVSSSSAIFRCNKGLASLLETNIVDHTRKLDCPFGMVSFQMLWFGSGKELQYVSASLIQWRGVVGEGASITLKIWNTSRCIHPDPHWFRRFHGWKRHYVVFVGPKTSTKLPSASSSKKPRQ